MDMDRAQREGFHFGAKLVRGAYMYLERAVAEKKKIVSPIWDTIEQTHLCYDRQGLIKNLSKPYLSLALNLHLVSHSNWEACVYCLNVVILIELRTPLSRA